MRTTKSLLPLLAAGSMLAAPAYATNSPVTPPTAAEKICTSDAAPAGALSLGTPQLLFKLCPTLADIATVNSLSTPLYNGLWYKTQAPMSMYQDIGGSLAISLGGDLATARALPGGKIVAGTLPLLDASKAFYVEFQVGLSYSNGYDWSTNNADHWPAVWLMPAEHNVTQDDHLASDPAKYERWMEMDVDEGGFGPGIHGAAINWSGIWPNYVRTQNSNHTPNEVLDRTKTHVFGLSYDPVVRKVTWWLDGVAKITTGENTDLIPPITYTTPHHYYLILSAQTHGASIPYTMHVYGVRTFVRP